MRRWNRKQYVCAFFCGLYVFLVLFLTLLSRSPYAGTHLKLIPFWNLAEIGKYGLNRVMRELLINFVMLIPLGIALRLGFSSVRSKTIVIGGFLLSLFIEVLQILFNKGAFEVNDLILNTLGMYFGDVLGRSCNKRH